MNSLILPEHHWALWGVLLSAAAFGLWAETTRFGSRLSGAVVTIGTAFILSNIGVLPVEAPAYGIVWSYFVPLAIPLLLFSADIRRILRESGPTLLAFIAGAVGTVIGTIVAFHLIPLGEEGSKLAGIFCATYIGGSLNYVASAEALDLRSGDLLTAGFAADNLVMTLYFLLLFALPAMGFLSRRYVRRKPPTGSPGEPGTETANGIGSTPLRLREMTTALAISAVCCAAGYGLAALLGIESLGILIVTGLSVFLASTFPGRMRKLSGAMDMGTLLMMVFFAVIGASANVGVVLRQGPVLFAFAGLILLIHLLFVLGFGRLAKLDLREIVIASNANMGGPTTAAAMATARNWGDLITPAILCGTLGYALATFIGVAVGNWLG